MKLKKKPTFLVAVVLALMTVLSACGGGNNNAGSANNPDDAASSNVSANTATTGAVDTSQAVTLKLLMIGSKPTDYDEVYGELNKLLKEKINATVETEFLDWSDWTQKYPLKFAANEDFDIAYTAGWAFYNDQVLKGGFLELTEEMLQTYAPKTWEAMPQASWDQAKVNGKLYMVPNNNQEVTDKVVLIREDLRKKYNLEPVNSPETYAAYLKAIGAARKASARSVRNRLTAGNGMSWTKFCWSNKMNGIWSITTSRWLTNWTIRQGKCSTCTTRRNLPNWSNIIKTWRITTAGRRTS